MSRGLFENVDPSEYTALAVAHYGGLAWISSFAASAIVAPVQTPR
jgi:hypothetical protein